MDSNALNLEEWSMGEYEVAKFAPVKGDANASSQKLYIPKMMPLISFGIPKTSTETLNKSIFLNDDACKPSVSSTVTTQNFKTVPKPANRKFERINLYQGATMQVEVKDGNPNEMYISTKVDPSADDKVTEEFFYKFTGTYSTPTSGGSITLNGIHTEKHT